MRAFEAALIFVNLLTLFLSFKKQSKGARLGAAGATLVILSLHGLLEGLRYQMALSYIFSILFAGYALVKAGSGVSTVRRAEPLKIAATGLAFFLLGMTALLAYALPVFTMPRPSGKYPVGIQYFHLVDEKRSDPFLDPSTKKRELMVKVYYPAQDIATKPYAAYFHRSPELIRRLASGYGLPENLFDHLNLVSTNSKEHLPLSGQQPAYPVVLFSHGAGTSMEVQTSQCEDLASHGYIVAAIDHTYASAATAFPERVVSAREATANFAVAEPAEIITQIMAEDARFVIDQLAAMNEGSIASIFLGRMNLEQIGAIGHSVGGAVAYNLAINEPRVKAAIDLDGVVYLTPHSGAREMTPFLMLANDQYHVQAVQERKSLMPDFETLPGDEQSLLISIYGSKEAYQAEYDTAQQNITGLAEVLKTSGNLYTIKGSDHMKFTDIGLWFGFRPLRELINIRGKTDPERCLEITKAVTLAFFDQQLKGENARVLDELVKVYPELKNVALK